MHILLSNVVVASLVILIGYVLTNSAVKYAKAKLAAYKVSRLASSIRVRKEEIEVLEERVRVSEDNSWRLTYALCAGEVVVQVAMRRTACARAEVRRMTALVKTLEANACKPRANGDPGDDATADDDAEYEPEVTQHGQVRYPGHLTIQDLPLELLQCIFRHAVEGRCEMRVVLSHVCRYWRDAVFAHPALWTTIVFDCTWTNGYRPILHQAFSLAKSLNLTLIIEWKSLSSWPYGEDELQSVLNLALAHKYQWQTLRFAMDTEQSTYISSIREKLASDLQGVDLPSLRFMTVRGQSTQGAALRGLCMAASNLLSLTLEVSLLFEPLCSLPNLQVLQIANCAVASMADFAIFLQTFPQLARLTISMLMDRTGEYGDMSNTVSMHSLWFLEISVQDDKQGISLLLRMDCPRLRHLVVSTEDAESGAQMFDGVLRIIRCKAWPLETLDISNLPCTSDTFEMLLKSLERVRRLALGDAVGFDAFQLLAATTASTWRLVLPALRELVIHGDCDVTLASHWVETRYWDPTTRLQSLAAERFSALRGIEWLKKLVVVKQFIRSEPASFEFM